MRRITFLGGLALFALVGTGCAASAPEPKAPVVHDARDYNPSEYVEMSFDGKPVEEDAKPAAPPSAHPIDKPNVAATKKGALFGISNKTKD